MDERTECEKIMDDHLDKMKILDESNKRREAIDIRVTALDRAIENNQGSQAGLTVRDAEVFLAFILK